MIETFTKAWFENIHTMREKLTEKHPDDYIALVRSVVEMLAPYTDRGDNLDPTRIHQIDDGDYQGCLLFVIAARGYQPHNYWYVKVSYGSCSGCDTLQSISGYSSEPPNDSQVSEYMTLALHIVQGLYKMEGCAA